VLVLSDNVGWGEVGCYGGGAVRGAPTPRIDAFSEQRFGLLNFNIEARRIPGQSAPPPGGNP
jgi:arylsulfatase